MEHKHHTIPRYMGGTDDPDNMEVLSITGHANAHKELYEKYGHWQDKVAWLALAKIITHEEAVRMACSEAGKIGSKITNDKFPKGTRGNWNAFGGRKKIAENNKKRAKIYKLVDSNRTIIETKGLVEWCKENNLHYKNFHKLVVQRKGSYKGYTLYQGSKYDSTG